MGGDSRLMRRGIGILKFLEKIVELSFTLIYV